MYLFIENVVKIMRKKSFLNRETANKWIDIEARKKEQQKDPSSHLAKRKPYKTMKY